MAQITDFLRKNIGSIVSGVGMVLLIILTFGDMGELFTDNYWKNVGGNLTSIGALTIGLVMIQVVIKQGVSEQALSAGLNTTTTKQRYTDHKTLINNNRCKAVYLPYFLSMRNKRETIRRKKEFLIDNNFTSEKALMQSKGNKKLKKAYKAIITNMTVDSIKWSTTKIVYNKNGRIEKLDEYRAKRAVKAIISSFIFMFASTLIAGGLFISPYDIPLWQKLVKLLFYIIVIGFSVVFDIGKNYEKGAFGVPNELDEINNIWKEFEEWKVPQWVLDDVERNNRMDVDIGNHDNEVIQKETKEHDRLLLMAPHTVVEASAENIESKEEEVNG